MGGLTGFSSLAEGYQRLDPSGRGQSEMLFFHPVNFVGVPAQDDLVRSFLINRSRPWIIRFFVPTPLMILRVGRRCRAREEAPLFFPAKVLKLNHKSDVLENLKWTSTKGDIKNE